MKKRSEFAAYFKRADEIVSEGIRDKTCRVCAEAPTREKLNILREQLLAAKYVPSTRCYVGMIVLDGITYDLHNQEFELLNKTKRN